MFPPLHVVIVGKVRSVDSRIAVCCKGVRNEIAIGSAHNDDGRIWSEEEVDVVAVKVYRGLGSNDESKNNSRLWSKVRYARQ